MLGYSSKSNEVAVLLRQGQHQGVDTRRLLSLFSPYQRLSIYFLCWR